MVLTVVGYAWLLINFRAGLSGLFNLPGVCIFYHTTGIPCPSCGVTRSLLLLFQAECRAAWDLNPLGIPMALGLLVIPCWIVVDMIRNRESLRCFWLWSERMLQLRWVSIVLVALLLLHWIRLVFLDTA